MAWDGTGWNGGGGDGDGDDGRDPRIWHRADRHDYYPPDGTDHWLFHRDTKYYPDPRHSAAADILVEYIAYRWSQTGGLRGHQPYFAPPMTQPDLGCVDWSYDHFAYRNSPTSLLGRGYAVENDEQTVFNDNRAGYQHARHDLNPRQLCMVADNERAQTLIDENKLLIMLPDTRVQEQVIINQKWHKAKGIPTPCDLEKQSAFLRDLFDDLGLPWHNVKFFPFTDDRYYGKKGQEPAVSDTPVPAFAIEWDFIALQPLIKKILDDKGFLEVYGKHFYDQGQFFNRPSGKTEVIQHPYTLEVLNPKEAQHCIKGLVRIYENAPDYVAYCKAFAANYNIDLDDTPSTSVMDADSEKRLGEEPKGPSRAGDSKKPND
jgi:hypothetical protein